VTWSFIFVNEAAKAELEELPVDMRASFERIVRLVEAFGLDRVHEPYIKYVGGRIWEMRLRGRHGIARALYMTTWSACRGSARLCQEDPKDSAPGGRVGAEPCQGGGVTRKLIPVEESFANWRDDPRYIEAYNALDSEFSLAAALIEARAHAGLTQEQLAKRMHTTPAVIARLEGGRVKPSTRTLERFAAATGMRLRITFEPAPAE
jgi:DNA-binding XRE family transcriptional regulator